MTGSSPSNSPKPTERVHDEFRQMVRRFMAMARVAEAPAATCPEPPMLIQLEPTNACNLRCTHCHHHVGNVPGRDIRKFGMMKWDVFTTAADQIAEMGCPVTLNVQGEPTLHPRFLDMVEYLRAKDVFTSVITNATRLDEAMARRLIDVRLNRIVFSFDSIEKDVYEAVRVRSRFEPTLRNVLRFIRLNQEAGHPTHICMSMVTQELTFPGAEGYREYFGKLPVDKVFQNTLLNLSGKSGTAGEIDLEALRKGRPRSEWPICRIPWEVMTVNHDGEICPCPVDVNLRYSLGNIKDETLMSMWNNSRMQAYRMAHITKNYSAIEPVDPLCSECSCLWQEEYDLRDYAKYAVEGIHRQAIQFAPQFVAGGTGNLSEKEEFLSREIERLG